MTDEFVAPDLRPELLESALARFVRGDGRLVRVVATDLLRSTPGWRGITGAEVHLLVERGCADLGNVEGDGRARISLTDEGFRCLVALAQSGKLRALKLPPAGPGPSSPPGSGDRSASASARGTTARPSSRRATP